MIRLPEIALPNQYTKTELPGFSFLVETKDRYGELLLSEEWRRKRAEILMRDKNRCWCCGREKNLEVHHKQYHIDKATGRFKMPWQYDDNYLVTLCAQCHQAGHKLYKIPIFFL